MAFPLRRLFHWGPLVALGIIKLVTWCTVHLLGMYWPPHETLGGAANGVVFLLLSGSTLYYFLQALFEGPGFVPLQWRPAKEEDTKYLQFCKLCTGYKAPRAHHCRKCGRCVMKMDHHCPWINCCVGHKNHSYFTKFLFFAVIGCFHASALQITAVYHALNISYYVRYGGGPRVHLNLTTLLLTLLSIGMAIGVVLAVGALLYLQIRGIVSNITTIEEWIMEKASLRRAAFGEPPLRFPYPAGWRRALRDTLRGARGDGLVWTLRRGAGQYDLTMEQLAQKEEKRSRAVLYRAVRAYGGGWEPLRRPRALCVAPAAYCPARTLAPGDTLAVTRHTRYWLYGEPVFEDGTRGERGWFPRDAVVFAEEYYKKDQ